MLFKDLPERKWARLLAISENLLIYKVWERGFVTDGANVHSVGAPIYGDPICAAIADDETWCAVGGAGIEILLALPGRTLSAPSAGDSRNIRIPWVATLWALGSRQLGVVTAPSADDMRRRLLIVDVDTSEVHEISETAD